ncbi:hypothetical protein [Maricaulis sp.]|uniref:hypothetical protein n=1 Tax=Maricaulis sp. TaxID=1486257 RepID=UPI00261ED89F|nr:hypothetical protein [Maricaulis sp.]
MKLIAAFAMAASMAVITTPSATAQSQQCIDDAKETCALFQPVGSFQWAYCVEQLIAFCPPSAQADIEEIILLFREEGQ